MAARTYIPQFDQSRFDNAQTGGDYYREHAERDLIPRIIERNRQALNVVPEFFQFYQRSYVGRRCSCWSGIETSPSPSCLVCYGSGNTAAYQLYGHRTEVLDVTAESAAVNVIVDYDEVTRPLHFRLLNQALKGWVDFTLPVAGGMNVCSLASLSALAARGSRVRCGIKLFSEPEFVQLSVQAVTDRLQLAQVQGGIHVRVILERDSVSAPSPRLSHVRIRYRTLEDDRVRGDIPRSIETNRSSEFGWFDDVETKSLFMDSTLRSITSEDLLRQVNSGRLFKVFAVNPNAPGGQLTSWDLQIRLVQNSERFSNLP